jgi:hypothetical protein
MSKSMQAFDSVPEPSYPADGTIVFTQAKFDFSKEQYYIVNGMYVARTSLDLMNSQMNKQGHQIQQIRVNSSSDIDWERCKHDNLGIIRNLPPRRHYLGPTPEGNK